MSGTDPTNEANAEPPPRPAGRGWRRALLERHRWVTFVLPLAVFMLAGSLEPKPPESGVADGWLAIPYGYYPIVYTAKIALTVAAILFVLPGLALCAGLPTPHSRQRGQETCAERVVSPLAVLVGLVGGVAWVGLCRLGLEQKLLAPVGLDGLLGLGTRSAFNPFDELQDYPAACAWALLAVRFFGLVVVIAVAEELFLRGFAMRFVIQANWWEVPFGRVSATAVVVGTLVPMLMHPAELLAAAVWFSLVTWLMVKTKNLWDCVAAHAVTNLVLGIYVVFSGQWHLM
ncbi:MAG TPA: CAAX prenyl protease-related protein [Thermoguttaceae bacterium]|nr:CAAX prenyl protease-related protein [Thermoguttaceae bacterium]